MKSARPAQRPPANADIWILAGQSNMEGCGDIREASPPDRRVWSFDLQHRWSIARDPLHKIIESAAPVDFQLRSLSMPQEIAARGPAAIRQYWRNRDRKTRTGAGLGISFGSAYARATGRPVGLISAAHGGTSLEQWSPDRKDEGLNSLYGAMLERRRLAGGNLRGILWYQGESDAWSPETAASYAERFMRWIEAVRRDTGQPKLPVVTVQIGCVTHVGWNAPSWNRLRQAQLELPRRVPGLAVAATVDLGLHDGIHIDAPGLQRLGRRMARLALGLTGHKNHAKDSPRLRKISVKPCNFDAAELHLTFTGVHGAWQPARQITGFSILNADGKLHPGNCVTAAYRHPARPAVIVVRLQSPPAAGDQLAYGDGTFPICNAVDEADMALPAFQTHIVN